MPNYHASKQADGVVKIDKTPEKIEKENAKLARDLQHKTIEEMIATIRLIAEEVGVEVEFTYDKRKGGAKGNGSST